MDSGVSVVVPTYDSSGTLPELVERISKSLHGRPHEIILVDDGSPRDTWATVEHLAEQDKRVGGLRLGRNFGQHNALLAGVRAARYDVVVTLDDDLQNPPEDIPRLLTALTDGFDVVYGTSEAVAQRPLRRIASRIGRRVIASALGAPTAAEMSSFRAFRTDLRGAFAGELGPAVTLDALLAWGTSRFTSVEVSHHPRRDGRSHYTLLQLARFAIDAITGYSTVPLQFATGLGIVTALFGLGVLIWVLGRALLGDSSVPGFPFLASTIAIFAGAQLITLGILGEYLARMHFRLMKKPSYVISEQTDRTPRGFHAPTRSTGDDRPLLIEKGGDAFDHEGQERDTT